MLSSHFRMCIFQSLLPHFVQLTHYLHTHVLIYSHHLTKVQVDSQEVENLCEDELVHLLELSLLAVNLCFIQLFLQVYELRMDEYLDKIDESGVASLHLKDSK